MSQLSTIKGGKMGELDNDDVGGEAGLTAEVFDKLDKMYENGKLDQTDLDKPALDALKQLSVEDARAVLDKFCGSKLKLILNKSAFLCSIMKTVRENAAAGGIFTSSDQGPNEEKIKSTLDRTGYSVDMNEGQRKYGRPRPGWNGGSPSKVLHFRNLTASVTEKTLMKTFQKFGRVERIKKIKDYAIIHFEESEQAVEAMKTLNQEDLHGANLVTLVPVTGPFQHRTAGLQLLHDSLAGLFGERQLQDEEFLVRTAAEFIQYVRSREEGVELDAVKVDILLATVTGPSQQMTAGLQLLHHILGGLCDEQQLQEEEDLVSSAAAFIQFVRSREEGEELDRMFWEKRLKKENNMYYAY